MKYWSIWIGELEEKLLISFIFVWGGVMENYSWEGVAGWDDIGVGIRTLNSDGFIPRSMLSTIKIIINYSLFGILVIWLILISYLIYRKHKWENWLWKKILKWDFIFFFIVVAIWCTITFILWYPWDPIQPWIM